MSSKIELSEAMDLYKAYRDDKRPLILKEVQDRAIADGRDPNTVTESKKGWISLDVLKAFINDIEAKGTLCNIPSADLGFSLYYGAYPDTNQDYPYQLTSLFVPTVKSSGGGDDDIVFAKVGGTTSMIKIKDVNDVNIVGEEKSIMNRVGQVPPPEVKTNMDTLIDNVN